MPERRWFNTVGPAKRNRRNPIQWAIAQCERGQSPRDCPIAASAAGGRVGSRAAQRAAQRRTLDAARAPVAPRTPRAPETPPNAAPRGVGAPRGPGRAPWLVTRVGGWFRGTPRPPWNCVGCELTQSRLRRRQIRARALERGEELRRLAQTGAGGLYPPANPPHSVSLTLAPRIASAGGRARGHWTAGGGLRRGGNRGA